jgi:amidase
MTSPGNEFVHIVIGPMASSARSLALYAQAMLQDEPWLTEPFVLPMPWQPSIINSYNSSRKISVAILW